MRLDMIADCRRRDDAALCTISTQRMLEQLMPSDSSPTNQSTTKNVGATPEGAGYRKSDAARALCRPGDVLAPRFPHFEKADPLQGQSVELGHKSDQEREKRQTGGW